MVAKENVFLAVHTERPPYRDWPECLPRYRWRVEDALRTKDPTRMFSVVSDIFGAAKWDAICVVCGSGYYRKDWSDHVYEHAFQLGIVSKEGLPRGLFERMVPYRKPLNIGPPEGWYDPGEVRAIMANGAPKPAVSDDNLTQSDADGNVVWEKNEPTQLELDARDTIVDAIQGRRDEDGSVTFVLDDGLLAREVLSAIYAELDEDDVGNPPLCQDCS